MLRTFLALTLLSTVAGCFAEQTEVDEPASVQQGLESADNDSTAASATTSDATSQRDPASGLPTGKRQHKPMTFIVELDR